MVLPDYSGSQFLLHRAANAVSPQARTRCPRALILIAPTRSAFGLETNEPVATVKTHRAVFDGAKNIARLAKFNPAKS